MAAELKALVSEHEAASPLQLSDVSMVVESDGTQLSVPDEQLQTSSRPVIESQKGQGNSSSVAKPGGAKAAGSTAQNGGATSQHQTQVLTDEKPSQTAHPDTAAASKLTGADAEAESPSAGVQHVSVKDSFVPPWSEQQEQASPGIQQISSAQDLHGTSTAKAEALGIQGSFLGKSLSGDTSKASMPKDKQLSTSQTQHTTEEGTPLSPETPQPANASPLSKQPSDAEAQKLHSAASLASGSTQGATPVISAKVAQANNVADQTAAKVPGSFLGKALSGPPLRATLPNKGQLSTSQAQQIADAAAAGNLPCQQPGGPALSGVASYNSRAAAASSASKGLAAHVLQPPKTSESMPCHQMSSAVCLIIMLFLGVSHCS